MVVDLPAPLEPSKPTMPFEGISRLMSLIAHASVYLCESPSTLTNISCMLQIVYEKELPGAAFSCSPYVWTL